MSLFYFPGYRPELRRFVGLSTVFHLVLLLCFWSILQSEIQVIKTTGVGVEIRTMPTTRRALPKPSPSLPMPALPTPRRKIGRIVEKKYQVDIPKLQPQAARRRQGVEDDVQLLKDRKLSKLIRSESVEMVDVEKPTAYKPPVPTPSPEAASMPEGDYVPSLPAPAVDVMMQYVDIAFEASKIDLDSVKWTPAAPQTAPPGAVTSSQPAASSGAAPKRRPLKIVKPEAPENMGIQESKVQAIVRIHIAESGFVTLAEIYKSTGYLELDNRALAAVRQWIFESSARADPMLVQINYVH
ncbi:TonB family protein [bacterium]|nr:TonB family protein [bacterium]